MTKDTCLRCNAQRLLNRLLVGIKTEYPAEAIAVGLLAGWAQIRGELPNKLAKEALSISGPYFEEGMIAAAADMAPRAALAAMVRANYKRYGFPVSPELDAQLHVWERIKPGKGL